ncbi:helix-turn-helix transcriptional regulator [Croceicoccus sp. 1NDH52]|nr:helix-turn-helix transcriptional regulator [Croceicoccus gelatinilyticus]
MSPQLSDFLDALFALPPTRGAARDGDREPIALFYKYLHACGIEHCNFGGFEISGDGYELNQFSGSLLPGAFLDEFTAEMADDDYIIAQSAGLSADKPLSVFDFGVPHLDKVRAFREESARVTLECARYGMHDGVAMVGLVPGNRSDTRRCFGFAFGGTNGSGDQARARLPELRIAAFALLDRIRPQVEAVIDGFEYDLSARELDVLGALADGAQRQQIAWKLDVSVPTVDAHLANLRRKLKAATLAEAVSRGYRYGLL